MHDTVRYIYEQRNVTARDENDKKDIKIGITEVFLFNAVNSTLSVQVNWVKIRTSKPILS